MIFHASSLAGVSFIDQSDQDFELIYKSSSRENLAISLDFQFYKHAREGLYLIYFFINVFL